MTRREIQAKLKERGISQAQLARLGNVKPPTISQLLRRRTKSKRLAALLDTILGTTGALR